MAKGAYAKSGVNRDLADKLVTNISAMVKKTLHPQVKSSVGGYASLYALNSRQYLAAGTDGVGTKLKLAFAWDSHHTVGIDLVAMSVNDLLCVGARPLFFLDYFATGKLQPRTAERVLSGIVAGCVQGGCALIGGETAEMPGFYEPGEYDLAGFAVGVVERKNVLPKRQIKAGDVLIGLGSSGFHSNGFSLIRKLFNAWKPSKAFTKRCPWAKSKAAVAKELLQPTLIYHQALKNLTRDGRIKGLAHITGSGFLNVPRMSDKVSYEITLPPVSGRARSFQWLEALQDPSLHFEELVQTFNMGIGMVIACDAKKAPAMMKQLRAQRGLKVWQLGHVTKRKGRCQVVVREGLQHAVLEY